MEQLRFQPARPPEPSRQNRALPARTAVCITYARPWPRPSSRSQKAGAVYIYRNQEGRTNPDSTIEDTKAMGMTDEASLEALRVQMLSSMA